MSKALIITLIAIVIIALGATAVYITQRQEGEEVKEEQPVGTIPEIDTSNWKTYYNEKYGFEVKYPPYFINKKMKGEEGTSYIFEFWDPRYYNPNPELYEIRGWIRGVVLQPISPQAVEQMISRSTSKELRRFSVNGCQAIVLINNPTNSLPYGDMGAMLLCEGRNPISFGGIPRHEGDKTFKEIFFAVIESFKWK